ncbi:MAG: prepilin-type N-terminal cleavage/methylation domain-containing protein [Bacillota bacterium]
MKSSGRAGFTLVEVMMAVFLLSLVAASALGLYQAATRACREQARVHDIQEHLRVGLDRLSRELRQARFLIRTEPDLVAFASSDGRTIEYRHDRARGQLNRQVINSGTAKPVCSHVAELVLEYYPAGETQAGKITGLVITLTGDDGQGRPVVLRSGVSLRCP